MDLDVGGVRESMRQLKLTEKPRLSQRARQRLSIKNKKQQLTESRSSPIAERREGRDRASNARSVSPPIMWRQVRGEDGKRIDRSSGSVCKYIYADV